MKFAFAAFISVALAAPQLVEHHKLRRATTAQVKPDGYIVVLKGGVSKEASIQALNDLSFAFDDTQSYREVTYDDWTILNGFAATLRGDALNSVLLDPKVEYVEEDGIVEINYA
jgi:hypothetical protein